MSDIISIKTSVSANYNVYTGSDLEQEILEFSEQFSSQKAIILVDELVFELHEQRFKPVIENKFPELEIMKLPRGEQTKSFEVYKKALDFVLTSGVERETPFFAIGGGVTGDLAGYVAATVLRGIPLIHIPTTLLAMVDSSIGGKTGINHDTGKNLIGSFYQPRAVFADVKYLQTLPQKEWVNGLSEVLKYGMIQHPEILKQILSLLQEDRFNEGKAWLPVIRKSAAIKADIVSQDVREAGNRAYLNFGHTFAHAIERSGNYKDYSHGEAVYAGMVAAVHASNLLGADIDPSNLLEFKALYDILFEKMAASPSQLIDFMKKDKKVKDNHIQLVLLKKMGQPYLHQVTDFSLIEQTWNHLKSIEK